MNTNTITAACVGVVLGGALADALEGVYVIATGTSALGGAIGVLYGVARDRRRRRRGDAIVWGPMRSADWQATGLAGGAVGAVVGLVLGIIDALLGA